MAIYRAESGRLPLISWGPNDNYPLDLAGDQRFARPRQQPICQMPYPPLIGGYDPIAPLYDVWEISGNRAKPGRSFYSGGQIINELGGTTGGIGSRDARFLKVLG